jgi:hypothetical protein
MTTETFFYVFGPALAFVVGSAVMCLVISYNAWKAGER